MDRRTFLEILAGRAGLFALDGALPEAEAFDDRLSTSVQVDSWGAERPGPLDLSRTWQPYPRSPTPTLIHPPEILNEDGRRVLRVRTDHESVKIWRPVRINLQETPLLTWEWKVLVLPKGGDVRNPRRNDQAARIMILFEGLKALVYVWDTSAPVGAEIRQDPFAALDRALIVIRSGPTGVGRWQREQRNVRADYRRLFDEEPRVVKFVGLEAHSDDVASQSDAFFGAIHFGR